MRRQSRRGIIPSLPFGYAPTPQAAPIGWAKDGGTVACLLLVDDEPTDLAILRGIVEQMGHEVYLASNGEEAFKTYLRKEIELVITDLEMPRVDGLEFIEALLGLYPDAKIIAVSAGGPDRLRAAKRAGAAVMVSKPVVPEALGKALALAGFDLMAQPEEDDGGEGLPR